MTISEIDRQSGLTGNTGFTPLAWGGLISVLGAIGVVATSVFYVAAPRAAAGPVQPLDVAAAMAAVVQGASVLRAAGIIGIFSDIVWACGALLLAQELGRRGQGLAAAGWGSLFVSILLFTLVDGITAYVFPPLAANGSTGAFEGFRRLWDMLFLLGTLAFAVGTVAVVASDLAADKPLFSKPLALGVLVVAIAGGVGAVAGLFGLPADQVVGASIGLGAILYVPLSLQILRAGRS
jgi:hypothetical protein